MTKWMLRAVLVVASCFGTACASGWKIQGGPQTCVEMCKGWNLEFAGMVGIGNQSPGSNEGATACVCQVPKTSASVSGAAAASASLAGPITAAQAAAAAHGATAQRSVGPGYSPP